MDANFLSFRFRKWRSSSVELNLTSVVFMSQFDFLIVFVLSLLARSVFGYATSRLSIIFSLFGGRRRSSDGYGMRGDLYVLVVGEPGMAKSRLLRCAEAVAERSAFRSARVTFSCGIGAIALRDSVSRVWTLAGGVMVIADEGVCFIDDMHRLGRDEKIAMANVMQYQASSATSVGIVSKLQARCAVVASSNPI